MSVSYTLRLPDDLKRLIELAAKSGGVSMAQLMVDACWKYMERGGVMAGRDVLVEGSTPSPVSKPDMAALRAICAGVVEVPVHSATEFMPRMAVIELCPHKEWAEDGEQYRCRLQAGHKGKCAAGERV